MLTKRSKSKIKKKTVIAVNRPVFPMFSQFFKINKLILQCISEMQNATFKIEARFLVVKLFIHTIAKAIHLLCSKSKNMYA